MSSGFFFFDSSGAQRSNTAQADVRVLIPIRMALAEIAGSFAIVSSSVSRPPLSVGTRAKLSRDCQGAVREM